MLKTAWSYKEFGFSLCQETRPKENSWVPRIPRKWHVVVHYSGGMPEGSMSSPWGVVKRLVREMALGK